MGTSQGRKISVFAGPTYFVAMPFRNGMGYVQRITSNISRCTGPIFAIFPPYVRALHADDGTVIYFPICQGTLPWQPNHLWTSGTTRPKKLAYFAKYFRIYWTYFRKLFTVWKLFMYRWWICTFFPNLVNFCPVISEFMLLKRAIFAAMHPQF